MRKRIVALTAALAAAALRGVCFAAENGYLAEALNNEGKPPAAAAVRPVELAGVLARVGVSLLFVIGIIFVLAYFLKKFVPFGRTGSKARLIRVIDIGYLTPKKMIYIVDVAGEVLVLGSDTGSITFLTKIDDPGKKEALLLQGPAPQQNKNFAGHLGAFIRDFQARTQPAGSPAVDTDVNKSIQEIHAQIEKLKGIKHEG